MKPKKLSHTPGPWFVDVLDVGTKWNVGTLHGDVALASQVVGDDVRQTRRSANARLMAASPDLLDAARLAEELVAVVLPKFNWGASALDARAIEILNEFPRVVRAAIAKAEEL